LITLKMATLMPMPSASERMAAVAKPRARFKPRAAYRKFWISIISSASLLVLRSNDAIAGPRAIVLKIGDSDEFWGWMGDRLWDVEVRYRHLFGMLEPQCLLRELPGPDDEAMIAADAAGR
jgi:hypothetical protein